MQKIKEDKEKILICDDEDAIREVLKTVLVAEGYRIVTAANGNDAVELFKKELPDLMLLDISMPGMTGFEVMEKVNSFLGKDSYVPVIFLTASITIDNKLRALHGGAVDYLNKPIAGDELIARIRNFLELKAKHDQLRDEATFDWMTGTLNKSYFLKEADKELEKSVSNSIALTFLLMDIDNFKEVNDTLGHLAGDRVIREFAERLKKVLRKFDIIGRFGGDEFMVMLPCQDGRQAVKIIERLKKAMKKPIPFEKNKMNVTVSVGIVEVKGSKKNAEDLLKTADKALYEAKGKGGNCSVMK